MRAAVKRVWQRTDGRTERKEGKSNGPEILPRRPKCWRASERGREGGREERRTESVITPRYTESERKSSEAQLHRELEPPERPRRKSELLFHNDV